MSEVALTPPSVPETVRAELDALVRQTAAVLAGVDSYVVETQDEFEMSAEVLQRIKGQQKRIEDWRKTAVAPFNTFVKTVNAEAAKQAEPLEGGERKVKGAIAGFLQAQERKRLELQRIADVERARQMREAEEARQKQLAEAAALEAEGDPDLADTVELIRAQAEEIPAELAAPAPIVQTVEKVSGVHMIESWKPVITDPVSFGLMRLRSAAEDAFSSMPDCQVREELRAALNGAVPFEFLKVEIRLADLKNFGSRTKGMGVMNGVTFEKEFTVASRAK
jgi:hypothetical protein